MQDENSSCFSKDRRISQFSIKNNFFLKNKFNFTIVIKPKIFFLTLIAHDTVGATMNAVVAGLALMGIAVAASELPLAFRKRETLLGKP